MQSSEKSGRPTGGILSARQETTDLRRSSVLGADSLFDPEAQEVDPEAVPLLPKGHHAKAAAAMEAAAMEAAAKEAAAKEAQAGSAPADAVADDKTRLQKMSSYVSSVWNNTPGKPLFDAAHNDKLIFYDHDSLLTYKTLLVMGKSVFCQTPVLLALVYCLSLATIAAVAMYFVPKSSFLDTRRFEAFGTFLKFFISFMLGVYVQQAFKRWWYTVTTFEKFLIAIRQMTFMLHTIKCDPAFRKRVENYCVASGYILNVEVRNAQAVHKRQHRDVQHLLYWLYEQGFLNEEESIQLSKCLQQGSVLSTTRAVWSWIGEFLSQPRTEEGAAIPVPMMVRIITLCQACITEIENLKMNITMQTPFMYAHLLSFLVHLNNTLLALACGLSVGSAFNEINRRHEQMSGHRNTDLSNHEVRGEIYRAFQIISLQMVYLLTPMLYVAFLHIAHQLCYPFGDEAYHLPTETFIARLHHELCQMEKNRKYYRSRVAQKYIKETRKKSKERTDNEEEDEDEGGD